MRLTLPVLALALASVPAFAQPSAVGLTRAVAAAERSLKARAIGAEFEASAGGGFYEVELVRGTTLHEARVDARTGKVVRRAQPWLKGTWKRWFDSDMLQRAANAQPLAGLLTRLEQQTSGKVHEVEFEVENGRAWYDVTVQTAAGITYVRLDPGSGRRLAALYDD